MIQFAAQILQHILDSDIGPILNGHKEVKNIGKMLSFAFENPGLVFPSRVLDSFLICGDPYLYVKSRLKLIEEWTSEDGKRILDELSHRKTSNKHVMQTGIQRWKQKNIVHYNMEQGITFFDNLVLHQQGDPPVQVRSFKAGPLRFVQSCLEQDIVSLIRQLVRNNRKDQAGKLITEIPTPTIEKIDYLHDNSYSRLSASEVDVIIDCYLAFLALYHVSENFFREGQKEIHFDQKEAKERIDALSRLLNGGIIKHD